jgi:retinol dehydrogenase-12
MSISKTIYSQVTAKIPAPVADFSGKTIIVTRANSRKEAVKHCVRLKASKVIIAVRSITKGNAAKAEIEKESKRTGVIEVWELDYSKYVSVEAFAAKVATPDRVDAVVLNSRITKQKYEIFEDNESCIMANVVSTTLLMLLLLPVMRDSAAKWGIVPAIVAVGSDNYYAFPKFPEWKTANSLATLNNGKIADMADWYFPRPQPVTRATDVRPHSCQVSKLVQLLAVGEIAVNVANRKPFVVVNTVNPGRCETDLNRSLTGGTLFAVKTMRALLARAAEEGSRTLVHGTIAGLESHGVFIENCKIKK